MKNLFLIASKQAIAILFAFFCGSIVIGQNSPYCGSTPSAADLLSYNQLINAGSSSPTPQSLIVNSSSIPIHFWIMKDNTGTNFPTPSIQTLDTWVSQMSSKYGFRDGNQFIRCGFTVVNNSQFTALLDPNGVQAFYVPLIQAHSNPNAINIYILNSAPRPFADFPTQGKAILLDKLFIGDANTLAHEMGHFFGLLHTFEGSSDAGTREQVSRNEINCKNKGDKLCDTEADYNTSWDCVTNPTCLLSCSWVDDNGVMLTPNTKNFMSYFRPICLSEFSYSQQKVIMDPTLYNNPLRNYLIINNPSCQVSPAYGTIQTQCPSITPLQNATINMTYQNGIIPCNAPLIQSNNNGEFIPCNLNTANSLTISPIKNTDYLNGVSTLDVSLIQKHILDITPITDPYKLVAADVSNSGDLDGADMLLIRQLILRTTTAYPNMGSWRFIPKRYLQTPSFLSAFNTNPFTASIAYNGVTREYLTANSYMNSINFSLSSPDAAQNATWSFAAVKMGDVSCNASSSLRIAQNHLTNATTPISIKSGKEATVLIKAKYAGKISTFQAGFKFTNSSLQVTSIEKGDFNAANDLMDYIKQDYGDIRTLWYNEKAKAKNFNSGVTVMKLKVKALKDIADLLSVLALDEAVLQSEFYDDANQ